MRKLSKAIAVAAVASAAVLSVQPASAWWGGGPWSNYGDGGGWGDMFGDMDFHAGGGGSGRAYGRGYGYGYGGYPYGGGWGGYPGYGGWGGPGYGGWGGPWGGRGYGYPAVVAPAATVEK